MVIYHGRVPFISACFLCASAQNQFRWAAEKLGLLPSMFFDEDEKWGRSRRLICPSLNARNVTDMIPTISHVRGEGRKGEEMTISGISRLA